MRQRVFAGHVHVVRSAFLDAVEPGGLATLTAVSSASAGGSGSRLRVILQCGASPNDRQTGEPRSPTPFDSSSTIALYEFVGARRSA